MLMLLQILRKMIFILYSRSKMSFESMPAEIKAKILTASNPDLEELANIACGLSKFFCREDVQACVQAFVPQNIFFASLSPKGGKWVVNLKFLATKQIPTIGGLDINEFLRSGMWPDGVKPTEEKAGIFTIVSTDDRLTLLERFGKQSLLILKAMYPRLQFRFEMRTPHKRFIFKHEYLRVFVSGIQC